MTFEAAVLLPNDVTLLQTMQRAEAASSRCGAVGSRSADFMCRYILRSDWSIIVSLIFIDTPSESKQKFPTHF